MIRGVVLSLFAMVFLVFSFYSVSAIPISSCQVINQSGNYELTQDLTFVGGYNSMPCIVILGRNISFNGQGHSITHTGAFSDGARAIGVGRGTQPNTANVDVRNVNINNAKYALYSTPDTTSPYANGAIGGSSGFRNVSFSNIQITGAGFVDRSAINLEETVSATGAYQNVTISNITMYYGQIFSIGGSSISPSSIIVRDSSLHESIVTLASHSLTYQNIRLYSSSIVPYFNNHNIRLINLSFEGSASLYGFDLANTVDATSINNTLIDGFIRSYNMTGSTFLRNSNFERSDMGSIKFTSNFRPGTGSELFTESSSSDIKIGPNLIAYPVSGAFLNVSAQLNFYGLPYCWTNMTLTRNGVPCSNSICSSRIQSDYDVVSFNVQQGGEYSVVNGGIHPECGGNSGPSVDFNEDGLVNVQDIFAFLSAWFDLS